MMNKISNRLYKKLPFVALLLAMLLQSCSDPNVNFEIHNNSEDRIDNIRLSTTGRTNHEAFNLASGNMIKYELDMENLPKHDGHYMISYRRNGKTEDEHFGYYTNGYPLTANYKITIMKDTLIIK